MKKFTTVDEFLDDLSLERRAEVLLLRDIIKTASPKLTEHIKWNSPSYIFNGEDRITFNMHYPDRTMILLHMGAIRKENKKAEPIMKDESGLIVWNSDIRGTLSFASVREIEARRQHVIELIHNWLQVA